VVKSAVLPLLCVLAGSITSVARADQLRVTSYDMDAQGGTVNLESDAPLGEPWMRIEGKMVKIWFPHIDQVSKFDHERDSSEAIKALALRAGGSDTGMLRVELGSQRHMSRDDIVVTRNGQQAQISLRMPAPKPNPTFVDPQAARAQQAAPAAAAQPAALQPTAAAPTQPLAATAPTPAPATEQPAAAANTSLAATGAKPDTDELGAIADDTGKRTSPIVWLGFACLILGGVWAGLSLMHKKKRPHELPAIEVVGSRRLGHRQELLIVRALGADHLLLCTSPHLPSLSLPPDTTAAAQPEHLHERPSQAGGLGIISRLSSQHRLRKLLDSVDNEGEQTDSDHDGSFSDELSSVTRKSRRPSLQSMPPAGPSQRPSEAVAGITRLRQRKG
jgi:hypothetical protein